MKRSHLVATGIAFASMVTTIAAANIRSSSSVVAELIGCSGPERDRLAAGDVVYLRHSAPHIDEAAAVIVDVTVEAAVGAMRRGDVFHANRRVLASEEIPDDPFVESAFESLPVAAVELANLASATPDADWNFSITEHAFLRDVVKAEGNRGAVAAFRHILAERTRAYRSGGLRAIASYVRPAGAMFRGGAELEALWARCAPLDSLLSGIHAAIAAYPRPTGLAMQHSYHASIIDLGGRSTVVLSHRVQSSGAGYSIVVERDIFASRVLGVRQTLIGATTLHDGRTIAFYRSSSSGDLARSEAEDGRHDIETVFAELRDAAPRPD